MPVKTRQLKDGKVRVKTPGGVKAKATTPAKAVRQKRLLDAIEHGWKPTGRKASQSASQKKARATIRRRLFN